jgi:4-amino-4-deoxy-L-arabinose transferase-like glycosyltransferase
MFPQKSPSTPKINLPILAILLLSAFLNLYRLDLVGTNGVGNTCYAAAVQSMLTSWRNFFYLSADSTGFVSLDKSPLAFWIQAALAKIFGFSGLPLLLPQALAGIFTVYIVYRLVRRAYEEPAALLAALALAIMPVSVVIQRNNSPDALMLLVLSLAAWTLLRALESDSPRWLAVTGALVGLAFNIKMLQILLILPAFAALYLWAAPWPWRKRLLYGLGACGIAVLVALPWVLAVDLTPPEMRPYVGGRANNTVLNLIVNYNGAARLWGEDFTYFSGPPGPLRLFNDKLGGQLSWILPLALLGAGAAAWQLRRDTATTSEWTARRNTLILCLAWVILPVVYFSISTFFHRYYLATIAPAVAALFGIGAQALWKLWRSAGRWRRGFVLFVVLLCAGVQVAMLLPFPGWNAWLIPLVAGLTVLGGIGLSAASRFGKRFQAAAFTFVLAGLLIAPLVWTLIPVFTCTDETLPYAGPQVLSPNGVCQPTQNVEFLKHDMLVIFEQGRGGGRYLAATHDMGIAILGILETNQPFMALGGFRGSDPILTVEQFAGCVARGQVRFYTAIKDEAEYPIQAGIRQWVKAHCPLVLDEGVYIWGLCQVDQ